MPEQGSLLDFAEANLKQDPNNLYTHDARNKEVVEMSVDEVGYGRSMVIDETNTILAGNNVGEIAEKKGAKLLIVDADRDTIVAVRRSDLSPYEKMRLGMLDNRGSEFHKLDRKAVRRVATANPQQMILAGVFTEKEQEKIFKAQANALEMSPGGIDDEMLPELQQPGGRSDSSIKTVMVFLTTETQPEFVRKVKALAPIFNTTSLSDTITSIIEHVHAEYGLNRRQALPDSDTP